MIQTNRRKENVSRGSHLDATDNRQLGHEWGHGKAHAAVQVDVGDAHTHRQPARHHVPNAQRHGQVWQRVYLPHHISS